MLDVPLGTLIFRAGLLGEAQLEDALQEGMRTGKRLGEVLLERGWLNERDLGQMLAGQKGLPFVDVAVSDVETEALEALDQDDARRQVALPLFYEDGQLVIAVGDPSNELVLESLRRELETDFQLVVAPHGQLLQVIDEAYSRPAPAPQPEGVLFPDLVPPARDEAPAELRPEPVPEPEPVSELEVELEVEPEAEAQPEPQPDLGFARALEPEFEIAPAPEPEPEPQAEAAPELETPSEPELAPEPEEKPFAGSTPTLLSRMLFPSVRHAAQEAEVTTVEEPEDAATEQPVEDAPEQSETPAPEQPETPAPAGEDLAELEVPAVPEMPIPSFEQQVAETEPAVLEEAPEPAAAEEAPEVAALEEAPEPAPEEAPEVAAPEEAPETAAPEEAPEVAALEEAPEPAPEEAPEPAAPEEAPEPAAEQPVDDAQPSTHLVVVRLRDGEALRIGEHGTAAEASAQAADAVAQISAAAGSGTWPLFSGRYLSPDTIVSVDLLEESPDA